MPGSITIIDGQNEDSIANDLDSEYNPCLPMIMDEGRMIEITFSPNITSFVDWFPSICSERDHQNEYMFDGGYLWNITNLRVTDYTVNDDGGYGLVRCKGGNRLTGAADSYISCTQCVFESITNENDARPLFWTTGSFHFSSMTMTGITTYLPIVMVFYPRDWFYASREFKMIHCEFSNITAENTLFKLIGSGGADASVVAYDLFFKYFVNS